MKRTLFAIATVAAALFATVDVSSAQNATVTVESGHKARPHMRTKRVVVVRESRGHHRGWYKRNRGHHYGWYKKRYKAGRPAAKVIIRTN